VLTLRLRLKNLFSALVGAWLSLARAPGSGPGGRWFKSTRPDHLNPVKLSSYDDLTFRTFKNKKNNRGNFEADSHLFSDLFTVLSIRL
jgi:hypothetical protein